MLIFGHVLEFLNRPLVQESLGKGEDGMNEASEMRNWQNPVEEKATRTKKDSGTSSWLALNDVYDYTMLMLMSSKLF